MTAKVRTQLKQEFLKAADYPIENKQLKRSKYIFDAGARLEGELALGGLGSTTDEYYAQQYNQYYRFLSSVIGFIIKVLCPAV